MTITISSETESLLREKSQREDREPNALADSLLNALLLSDAEDYEDACAGIAEGLSQLAAGQSIAFEDFVAQLREQRASNLNGSTVSA